MAKRAKARAVEALAAARDQVDRAGKALQQAETLVAAIQEGPEAARAKGTLGPAVPSFAAWLRLKLTEEGVGEKELAERAGVAYGTTHAYLAGTTTAPSLANALRLLIALDGDLDDFLRIGDLVDGLSSVDGFAEWKKERYGR